MSLNVLLFPRFARCLLLKSVILRSPPPPPPQKKGEQRSSGSVEIDRFPKFLASRLWLHARPRGSQVARGFASARPVTSYKISWSCTIAVSPNRSIPWCSAVEDFVQVKERGNHSTRIRKKNVMRLIGSATATKQRSRRFIDTDCGMLPWVNCATFTHTLEKKFPFPINCPEPLWIPNCMPLSDSHKSVHTKLRYIRH